MPWKKRKSEENNGVGFLIINPRAYALRESGG